MYLQRLLFLVVLLLALVAPTVDAAATNDPGFGDQWGLQITGAADAWGSTRGAGVTVAAVDTGADLGHEDLAANLVAGMNVVDPDEPPEDDHGHGTHVAGTVGAITGNGRGVASVAPEAGVMPVRVLEGEEGSCADVSEGIRWSVRNGADVVNLSLGPEIAVVGTVLRCIEDAVDEAWAEGAIPVIAAGNDFLPVSAYATTNAIIVSATTPDDRSAGYSNGSGDAKWGMAAPGSEILSTWKDDGYASASGTSMATPHVSGAAALLRSLGAGQRETVDVLLETAKDLPGSKDGHGRLDVAAAVAAATEGSSEQVGDDSRQEGAGAGTPREEVSPTPLPTAAPSADPSRSPESGATQDGHASPGAATSEPRSVDADPTVPDAAETPEPDADGRRGAPSPLAGSPTGEGGGTTPAVALGVGGTLIVTIGGLALWLSKTRG